MGLPFIDRPMTIMQQTNARYRDMYHTKLSEALCL